ncbi:hypothetical protein OH77DRAFT_953797 [Trametes cingulata]|nr:hypothetical protein OH77DRAFT_953797 [Trametes cingulata]
MFLAAGASALHRYCISWVLSTALFRARSHLICWLQKVHTLDTSGGTEHAIQYSNLFGPGLSLNQLTLRNLLSRVGQD